MIPVASNVDIQMVKDRNHVFSFQNRRLSRWRKDISAEYRQRRDRTVLLLWLDQVVGKFGNELGVRNMILKRDSQRRASPARCLLRRVSETCHIIKVIQSESIRVGHLFSQVEGGDGRCVIKRRPRRAKGRKKQGRFSSVLK